VLQCTRETLANSSIIGHKIAQKLLSARQRCKQQTMLKKRLISIYISGLLSFPFLFRYCSYSTLAFFPLFLFFFTFFFQATKKLTEAKQIDCQKNMHFTNLQYVSSPLSKIKPVSMGKFYTQKIDWLIPKFTNKKTATVPRDGKGTRDSKRKLDSISGV
jgi:hypothetical protein